MQNLFSPMLKCINLNLVPLLQRRQDVKLGSGEGSRGGGLVVECRQWHIYHWAIWAMPLLNRENIYL